MTQNPHNFEIKNDSWRNRMIATPRLVVRAFQPEDAEDLYEYLSNDEIYRFEPGEPVDRQQAQNLAVEMSTSPDFLGSRIADQTQSYRADLSPTEGATSPDDLGTGIHHESTLSAPGICF